MIQLELALGMLSEENQMARIQIIQQAQTQLYTAVSQMAASGALTEQVYHKIKRPYEDMLYVLGVKDVDTYLPSDEEVLQMIQQSQQAAEGKQPTPAEQKDISVVKLNEAKTQEIMTSITGENADTQLEYMSMAQGNAKVYNN
jgi:hypothetical protein